MPREMKSLREYGYADYYPRYKDHEIQMHIPNRRWWLPVPELHLAPDDLLLQEVSLD